MNSKPDIWGSFLLGTNLAALIFASSKHYWITTAILTSSVLLICYGLWCDGYIQAYEEMGGSR